MRAAVGRAASVVAMVAVALGAALPAVLLADSVPASGICGGVWVSRASNVGWGYENSRYPSTCDGDSYYAGYLADILTDGSCVRAGFEDIGIYSTQGTSCSRGGANYSFRDRNGDSSSYWQICRNQGCSLFGNDRGY